MLGKQDSSHCGGGLFGIFVHTVEPFFTYFSGLSHHRVFSSFTLAVKHLGCMWQLQCPVHYWCVGCNWKNRVTFRTWLTQCPQDSPLLYFNELTRVLMSYAANMVAIAQAAHSFWFPPSIHPCLPLCSSPVAPVQWNSKMQFPDSCRTWLRNTTLLVSPPWWAKSFMDFHH